MLPCISGWDCQWCNTGGEYLLGTLWAPYNTTASLSTVADHMHSFMTTAPLLWWQLPAGQPAMLQSSDHLSNVSSFLLNLRHKEMYICAKASHTNIHALKSQNWPCSSSGNPESSFLTSKKAVVFLNLYLMSWTWLSDYFNVIIRRSTQRYQIQWQWV